MMMTKKQQEYLRRQIRKYLAMRYPLSFPADAIEMYIVDRNMVDFDIDSEGVIRALNYLQGLDMVTSSSDNLSETLYYKITPHGIESLGSR